MTTRTSCTASVGETPTPEERALYIGDRLFNLTTKRSANIWGGEYDEITWETEDESFSDYSNDKLQFTEWLSTPDGLNAVEEKMIARGYHIGVMYNYGTWWCDLQHENADCRDKITEDNTVKSEAELNAVYKALKGEEDGNNTKS